ncbi:MAG: bifunctional DNA-formamidopyrimidine glycosylase/DNA-(apurinic or apyrimidinic site) lyase [Desulfovibrionaceae bacterium]|nr:bifunctional DNA-formamidopyrimidine glycosylase/DNA-(apurinic or apyrimidinic site) lyase [Desulfovibrionaceae bacterium]
MPELPEVETIVRTLRPKILNACITNSIIYSESPLLPISLDLHTLHGHYVTDVQRRGKLVLLKTETKEQHTSPHATLYMLAHLRMTGALLVKAPTAEPDLHSKLKLDLKAADGAELSLFFEDIRGFGQIYVCTPNKLQAWDFWQSLGPEPLEIGLSEFNDILKSQSSKRIKALLLDQHAIAGLGNIYADESLFAAHIHPMRKASSLTEDERKSLLEAIQSILKLAIEQCGTSVRNYRDANGQTGAFQNSLAVYGQAGKKCPRCGQTLEKIHVAGRGTVICPSCQPL